jgi:CubicO group peptidase (beta-lactamase class C family)
VRKITQRVIAVFLMTGALTLTQAREGDPTSAQVDTVVDAQRKAQKIPGVSLAVCRDGKIVKASGYGMANLEWVLSGNNSRPQQS